MTISLNPIVARAVDAAFGRPLVTNTIRGLLVEAMVADALGADWTWCAADYASWDFEHSLGTRLEVKQAAARQTWTVDGAKPSRATFDIAPRSGRWEDRLWVDERGRAASIYIFAHHPVADVSADHREPLQWDFYVVRSSALPANDRIALGKIRKLSDRQGFECLRAAVSAVTTV